MSGKVREFDHDWRVAIMDFFSQDQEPGFFLSSRHPETKMLVSRTARRGRFCINSQVHFLGVLSPFLLLCGGKA